MRTKLFISAFLAGTALCANAHAQSVVNAGEHSTYSRVVFDNAGDAVELRQNGRLVRLTGVNTGVTYDFQNINIRRKAHRILSAKRDNQSTIELRLTCDCKVRSSTLQNGKFVVDVYDNEGKPPVKSVSSSARNDKLAQEELISIEEAHSQMITLLKEAAREGLITIRDDLENEQNTSLEETELAAAPGPQMLTPPSLSSTQSPSQSDYAVDASKSVQAAIPVTQTSAYLGNQTDDRVCLPSDAFTIDGTLLEEEPLIRIAELQAALAETDEANRSELVMNLVAGYMAIGFGEEALALLIDTGKGESLFSDLARTVAEQPLDPDGVLLGAQNCTGTHALWQAVAGDPSQSKQRYTRSEDAISELPSRLKRLVSTKLAAKMIIAEEWDQAKALYAIASEGVAPLSPELEYIRARIEKAQGETAKAQRALLEIASQNNNAADDALLALADSYETSQATPHDGFTQDIGALAKLQGTSRASMAEASSWARLGNVDAALLILQTVGAKSPEDHSAAQDLARTILNDAFSANEHKQIVSALDSYVEHRSWLSIDHNDELRRQAANASLGLSLPNLSYGLLDEGGAPTDVTAAAEKARAALEAGYSSDAIALAAPYVSQDGFAEIIVDANIDKGEYSAALAAAASINNDDIRNALSARAAWLAGSWNSALESYQALDPNTLSVQSALNYAFTAYMADQNAFPAGAQAALSEHGETTIANGLEALFANHAQGSPLQRSRHIVEQTALEIPMFEEALSDG